MADGASETSRTLATVATESASAPKRTAKKKRQLTLFESVTEHGSHNPRHGTSRHVATSRSDATDIDSIPTWERMEDEAAAWAVEAVSSLDACPDWLNEALEVLDLTPKDAKELASVPKSQISIFPGDITTLGVDAIVNAANSSLLGGGGVDGAIHAAAGPLLKDECRPLAPCPAGECRTTTGHNLPAKHILHTVGPFGENPFTLSLCYANVLKNAEEAGSKSIAFCCVGTGVYGYPKRKAALVALSVILNYLSSRPTQLERVIFCTFTREDQVAYHNLLQAFFE